ncbi:MAG: DEAD/DEAH box helicase [Cyclobacteriaceae bacterium]
MSFQNLGLSDALLKAVSKKGYTTPSPIQEKVIPVVLEERDVLASAQTGTGKTAGFSLPMIQLLSQKPVHGSRPVRALILTPTRELAAQVHEDVKTYSEFTDLRSSVIFGGVNANPQIRQLREGVDILIATPGRLLDLHNQRAVSLKLVQIFVLDEADRMLDMGFVRDIKKIMALIPEKRQSLLFSATFNKEIKALAKGILRNPVPVEATPENTTAEKVNQKIYRVDKSAKTNMAIKLIKEGDWQQVLVFTRTKHGANKLVKKMISSGLAAAAIHGNKTQGARTKALAGFKDGNVRVLVATDIASRGLDIPLLPHVLNFELPNIPEDYVHRIGRTGRAGAGGEAISLVSLDEVEYVKGIEKLLGQRFNAEIREGFEPTETQADVKAAEERKKENKRQHFSKRGNNSGGGRGGQRGGGNSRRRN